MAPGVAARGAAVDACAARRVAAEMTELERTWAIASAHAEGVSIRKIAAAGGLGPTRVHAIVRDAELDGLDAALGELRSLYGWPAPEDPDGSRDEELAGRELIAERLVDEVRWLRDCASWLEQLELGEYQRVSTPRPRGPPMPAGRPGDVSPAREAFTRGGVLAGGDPRCR